MGDLAHLKERAKAKKEKVRTAKARAMGKNGGKGKWWQSSWSRSSSWSPQPQQNAPSAAAAQLTPRSVSPAERRGRSPSGRKNVKFCKHFRSGNCTKGKECNFGMLVLAFNGQKWFL